MIYRVLTHTGPASLSTRFPRVNHMLGLAGSRLARLPMLIAPFDVTDQEAVVAGVELIETEYGPIEVLVNNAGIQRRAPLEDFPAETWRELGRPSIAPYAASKGAVKMLTKGMCADWAPHGLQVNGIGPGYFATELTRPLVENAEFTDWLCRRTPAGRWGEVEELMGAAIFLASAASDFVNGQILYVDGGMTSVV
jgi:gluconate 5-dehydrogenase